MSGVVTGIVPREVAATMSGFEFLTAIAEGRLPQPPIAATLGFQLVEVAEGRVVFEGLPELRHYNPIGTVHGGFAATLLDSCMACAVHTTVPQGHAYTSLEIKVNFVRPITEATGPVRAVGRIIHAGRTTGTSEGRITDRDGKLLAHGTTTCMIFTAR
ncbi:MAG: PaaI family thioesterase [Hyphomicrobiaceae bacterium]